MKRLVLALLTLVAVGCTQAPTHSGLIRVPHNSLTHKAYYWIGLHERRDRQTIKAIMGIDPVRTEWCAAFVNMVLLENEIPTSASVSPYPLTARSFLKWGEEVSDPKPGDILIFKRGNEGWQGHVGFYVSHYEENGETFYNVLGGNQSDQVSIEAYSERKLLGIRRAGSSV